MHLAFLLQKKPVLRHRRGGEAWRCESLFINIFKVHCYQRTVSELFKDDVESDTVCACTRSLNIEYIEYNKNQN